MKENKRDTDRAKKRELLEYIRGGAPHLLRETLHLMHPAELCSVLRLFKGPEEIELINALDNDQLIDTFRLLVSDSPLRSRLLSRLPAQRLTQIIQSMPAAQAIRDLFAGLPEPQANELIDALPSELRRETEALLNKKHVGIAALVTDDFMKVAEEIPIAEVLRIFREVSHSSARPNQVYVVDSRERLVGTVDLHRLLLAEEHAEEVGRVAGECPLSFKNDTDPVAAARALLHYGIESAPVTDPDNRLTGIITSCSAYRLLDSEKQMELDAISGIGRRAGTIFVTLLAALGVSALLEALIQLSGARGLSLILPLAPLSIAIGRLYFRQTVIVLQKRISDKSAGVVFRGGQFRAGALAAMAISLPAGCLALIVRFEPTTFLFVGFSSFLAAAVGASAGVILFHASKETASSRVAVLGSAFLSIADLFVLLAIYGLYRLFL